MILKNTIFRTGFEEKSSLKPLLISIVIFTAYVVFISFYIWFSGKYAAIVASSEENLQRIELIKGLIFVFVTGWVLFFSSFLVLSKIKKRDEIIISQNKSLIASERLAFAGMFSSSICHDINNLLFVVRGNAELLSISRLTNEKEKAYLKEIRTASETLGKLVKRMMAAARGHMPGQKEYVNGADVIKEAIEFAKIHKTIKLAKITSDLPENMLMIINTTLFSRALMNLILNAVEAATGTCEIKIKANQNNDSTIIEVHDNGPGISDELKERILEPFFTTKKDGNGLGLLSLKICAEEHKARIEIKPSELGGACFYLTFPKFDTQCKSNE